jgi:hypothetical protein
MDDLLLVYDTRSDAAFGFAINVFTDLKRYQLGLSCRQVLLPVIIFFREPQKRNDSVNGFVTTTTSNAVIVLTKNMFTDPNVINALKACGELKKNVVLLRYLSWRFPEQIVGDVVVELSVLSDDLAKKAVTGKQECAFIPELQIPSTDNLVSCLGRVSALPQLLAVKERREELEVDHLKIRSAKISKYRIASPVHKKFDFCVTFADPSVDNGAGKAAAQFLVSAFGRLSPALSVTSAAQFNDDVRTQFMPQQIRESFNLIILVTKNCFNDNDKFAYDVGFQWLFNFFSFLRRLSFALKLKLIQSFFMLSRIQLMLNKNFVNVKNLCTVVAYNAAYVWYTTKLILLRLYGKIGCVSYHLFFSNLCLPGNVKTDENKSPRSRASGIPSFRLGFKNFQALDLPGDGRMPVYKLVKEDNVNKTKVIDRGGSISFSFLQGLPSELDESVKSLFELFDTSKSGRISWDRFVEIDRVITEALGGQYNEMVSRRIYSLMIYPGLSLDSDISYKTFYNYHNYVAKAV